MKKRTQKRKPKQSKPKGKQVKQTKQKNQLLIKLKKI